MWAIRQQEPAGLLTYRGNDPNHEKNFQAGSEGRLLWGVLRVAVGGPHEFVFGPVASVHVE
jgi:hypothetical protein